jgi:hypothetical protein
MRRHLRGKENFAGVRIFYWSSRLKTENLDVARIRRERTRDQAWFTRDRSSIRQIAFFVARDRACLRPPDIGVTRRRWGWLVRSLIILGIAWRSLFTLMRAPVRPRRLFRVSDCAS